MSRPRLFTQLIFAGLIIFGSLAISSAGMTASSVVNVAGIEGLPLMPGLHEKPGERVIFDTPGGRIIEAFASGSVTIAEVTAFYKETLSQLGWRQLDDTVFEREGEKLTIDFPAKPRPSGTKSSLAVRFAVRPSARPKTSPGGAPAKP